MLDLARQLRVEKERELSLAQQKQEQKNQVLQTKDQPFLWCYFRKQITATLINGVVSRIVCIFKVDVNLRFLYQADEGCYYTENAFEVLTKDIMNLCFYSFKVYIFILKPLSLMIKSPVLISFANFLECKFP